jgi:hypothetical protein
MNAHRRCRRMHWWSLGAISVISIYVLILSVYPLVFTVTADVSNYIYVASITSSVGILALSVFESGKSYMVKSERFVMCGRELGKLLRDLDVLIDKSDFQYRDIENIISRYNNVLDKYAQNHTRDDFDYFRASNSEFDLLLRKKLLYIFKWNARVYWKPILFCLTPPATIFAVL